MPAAKKLSHRWWPNIECASGNSGHIHPARGAPRGGDINGWVRSLPNDARVYEELRPVFREYGLEIRLVAVEKVLVQRANLLRFFEKLREAGTRPEDKVPFDCQTWFSVRPTGKDGIPVIKAN